MIGRVLDRGKRVGGLVRYLYGPGKAEEHRDPHIVASWSGEAGSLEPPITARGHRDFRTLVGLLEAPLAALPEWLRIELPVYHVIHRAAAEDRILSDAEWAELATETMHSIGLSRRGEADAGVRWIAVRHADDHIHIVATLARQDGATPRHGNDWYRVRETCRAFEKRYGLRQTARADATAARRPHRAELENALRAGRRETVRDRLRREVRTAAAVAVDEPDFLARLETAGVRVKLRVSTINPDEVTGYAVTLPGTRTADGTPIWYGGGRLAADLTLPKLRQRWTAGSDGNQPGTPRQRPAPVTGRVSAQRRRVLAAAARAATAAAEEVRRSTQGSADSTDAAAATVAATADTLAAAARIVNGPHGGRLSRAADRFDHAARERYGRVPRSHRRAEHTRAIARLIAAIRRIHPDDDALQAAELISRMASVADAVALLRRQQQRNHQAVAARNAAADLRAVAADLAARTSTATDPMVHAVANRRGTARPPRVGDSLHGRRI